MGWVVRVTMQVCSVMGTVGGVTQHYNNTPVTICAVHIVDTVTSEVSER